jgi:hypothetical protein
VPWIYECASKLNFPYHAYELAKWGTDLYEAVIETRREAAKNEA